MNMLQYINVLKGCIFLKIHVQFGEKKTNKKQKNLHLDSKLVLSWDLGHCVSSNFTTNLSCMHCLLYDDVSAFKQMRMYFANPVKETYHGISILNICHKSILPVLKIRLKYKDYYWKEKKKEKKKGAIF